LRADVIARKEFVKPPKNLDNIRTSPPQAEPPLVKLNFNFQDSLCLGDIVEKRGNLKGSDNPAKLVVES
jgi:hypothetical protein